MIYKSPATTFVTVSDGAPATSYSVVPSVTTMTRNVSNTVLSPASVTFSAYAKTGEAAQEAYTGYLYAECSYDGGGTWSAVSGAAASSQTCAPEILSNGKQLTGIRASLYTDAEMGTLLARVSVSVVLDDAAVQVLLCEENGEVRVNGANLAAGSVAARSIDVEDLFAQDITATGTISGLKLRGESIDISSEYVYDVTWSDPDGTPMYMGQEAASSVLKTGFEIEGAAGNNYLNYWTQIKNTYTKVNGDIYTAEIMMEAGGVRITGNGLTFQSETPIVVRAPCETDTYTEFDGGVVTEGNVTVAVKMGWCLVHGRIKLDGTVSDLITVLDSSKVPAPQTRISIGTTAGYWTSSYTRLMRVVVGAGGGLRIMYGAAGLYDFAISYPVA